MKTLSLTALAASACLAMAVAGPADAQRYGDRWHRGQAAQGHQINPQLNHGRSTEVPFRSERQRYYSERRHIPRHGSSARHYQRFHPHARHRLGPPPRGHHYRQHGNRVVLVDDRTLQVVTVLGLLGALLY